MLDIDVYA